MTKYQHYKGGAYTVIGIGKHTENREELVAYTDKYGDLHFRPKDMFFDKVEVDGVMVDRFKEIKPITRDEMIKETGNYMNNLLKKYGRNKS